MYVTLFLANFYPLPLSHFVTHPGTPRKVRHTSRAPQFLVGPTNNSDQNPLYKFSLKIVREGFCLGVLSEGLLSGRFCLGWFLSIPLLSEYICYNRMLNITLNFMFHKLCMIKKCISGTSHAVFPPSVTNCHTFSDSLPHR